MAGTSEPMTEQEIIEAPVTGMTGRTPRDMIEKPKTDRELEVIEIIDVSGSNGEPAGPDSPMTKQELIIGAQPHLVGALEGDDSQAAREQSGGSSAKGGVRVFYANEPQPIEFKEGEDESDDERDGGDHNTANVLDKLKEIPWGGRTYLMPAINAAEYAYQAEFGEIPLRKRPAMEVLIVTDGKLNDPDEFEGWLAQADELCVIAVAVIGFGKGHDMAVEHYQALAEKNKFITCVALTGVSDPREVALDLRLLSGTAPAS
jgi:hypothetical protein